MDTHDRDDDEELARMERDRARYEQLIEDSRAAHQLLADLERTSFRRALGLDWELE